MVLNLQQTIGNKAVGRLLTRRGRASDSSSGSASAKGQGQVDLAQRTAHVQTEDSERPKLPTSVASAGGESKVREVSREKAVQYAPAVERAADGSYQDPAKISLGADFYGVVRVPSERQHARLRQSPDATASRITPSRTATQVVQRDFEGVK